MVDRKLIRLRERVRKHEQWLVQAQTELAEHLSQFPDGRTQCEGVRTGGYSRRRGGRCKTFSEPGSTLCRYHKRREEVG